MQKHRTAKKRKKVFLYGREVPAQTYIEQIAQLWNSVAWIEEIIKAYLHVSPISHCPLV